MHRLFTPVICLGFFLSSPAAGAQDRIALTIARSTYAHATPLKNPVNDVRLLTEKLESVGFVVIKSVDEPRNLIGRQIGDFLELAKRKPSVALVFFAGHGAQVEGINYLIPIDAEIQSERDLKWTAISLNFFISELVNSGAPNMFIVLDACRNDPFAGRVALTKRGLARSEPGASSVATGGHGVDTSRGIVLSYSTAPGDTADDGVGDHSPYALFFAEILENPGVSHVDFMFELRNRTRTRTKGAQIQYVGYPLH